MINEIDKRYFLMTQEYWDKKPYITNNDIAIGCPICNEGKSRGRKQRLHLYQYKNNTLIHCFNCDHHSNMYNYLKQVNLDLYNSYKNEKRFNSLDSLSYKSELTDISTKIKLNKLKNKLKIFNIQDFNFIEATNSKRAMAYLYSRNILSKNFNNFYYIDNKELKLKIKDEEKIIKLNNGIIIPFWFNKKENLIYGFQYRSLDRKYFFTYLPEENSNYKMYNYFNLSFKKHIYVFESVFDMYSNDIPDNEKISILGSDLSDVLLNEAKEKDCNIILCLDNQNYDKTAYNKLLKYTDINNIKIFLWNDKIKYKDFNELLEVLSKKYNNPHTKISNLIQNNIYSGLEAKLRLKLL